MAFINLSNKDKKELRDIIDQMTAVSVDSSEKVEMAVDQGCPRAQFIPIVNQKTGNDQLSLKPMLRKLKGIVEEEQGRGAFDEEEIESLIESLVRNNHDLIHFQKLVGGFDVSSFVVNTIVEIRTRSPIDAGQAFFDELFQIEGVEPVENKLEDEAGNALDVERLGVGDSSEKPSTLFNPEVKKMLTDIVLGVGLGVSAIALLV